MISHAEIAINSFNCNEKKESKVDMVEHFFQPVTDKYKLEYKIKISLEDIESGTEDMSFAKILYKIRCEYTHEGNYTGKIFKRDYNENCSLLISFSDNGNFVTALCNITYQEFINIFMDALLENVKMFSGYEIKNS